MLTLAKVRIALLFSLICSPLLLQNTEASEPHEVIGTHTSAFLSLGSGARVTAMGNAFVGAADDVNAIYWNPAGLNNIQGISALAAHAEWFDGFRYEYLGYAHRIDEYNIIGFSAAALTTDDILITTYSQPEPTGETFSSRDIALSACYATKFLENIYVGLAGKFINQKIGESSATSAALDLGIQWETPVNGLRLGGVFQNAGAKISFISDSEIVFHRLMAGAAYRFLGDRLRLDVDVVKPFDESFGLNVGGELRIINKQLAFRYGYSITNNLENVLTAGLGIDLHLFQFDYAFVPYGDLGNTHRVSLSVRFKERP